MLTLCLAFYFISGTHIPLSDRSATAVRRNLLQSSVVYIPNIILLYHFPTISGFRKTRNDAPLLPNKV